MKSKKHCFKLLFFLTFIYLAFPGLNCGMWELVPWPGIKPRTPELRAWSLCHWATREIPLSYFLWKGSSRLIYQNSDWVTQFCLAQGRTAAECLWPPRDLNMGWNWVQFLLLYSAADVYWRLFWGPSQKITVSILFFF